MSFERHCPPAIDTSPRRSPCWPHACRLWANFVPSAPLGDHHPRDDHRHLPGSLDRRTRKRWCVHRKHLPASTSSHAPGSQATCCRSPTDCPARPTHDLTAARQPGVVFAARHGPPTTRVKHNPDHRVRAGNDKPHPRSRGLQQRSRPRHLSAASPRSSASRSSPDPRTVGTTSTIAQTSLTHDETSSPDEDQISEISDAGLAFTGCHDQKPVYHAREAALLLLMGSAIARYGVGVGSRLVEEGPNLGVVGASANCARCRAHRGSSVTMVPWCIGSRFPSGPLQHVDGSFATPTAAGKDQAIMTRISLLDDRRAADRRQLLYRTIGRPAPSPWLLRGGGFSAELLRAIERHRGWPSGNSQTSTSWSWSKLRINPCHTSVPSAGCYTTSCRNCRRPAYRRNRYQSFFVGVSLVQPALPQQVVAAKGVDGGHGIVDRLLVGQA